MSEHEFTLIIAGNPAEHLDELFDAGCGDATFGEVDGVQHADFTREAATLEEAIASAVRDVESVAGLRVERVEPRDLTDARRARSARFVSRPGEMNIIPAERREED